MGKVEGKFQTDVVIYLRKSLGGIWYVTTTASYGTKGTPDIIGCYKGLYGSLEMKREDGKGTREEIQKYEVEKTIRAGGISMFAESWDDVYEFERLMRAKAREIQRV